MGAGDDHLLIDLEISSGHVSKAADRARKQLAHSGTHTALLEKVSEALLQAGKAAEAIPLIRELRGPMIEAGEQDKFLKLLSSSMRSCRMRLSRLKCWLTSPGTLVIRSN